MIGIDCAVRPAIQATRTPEGSMLWSTKRWSRTSAAGPSRLRASPSSGGMVLRKAANPVSMCSVAESRKLSLWQFPGEFSPLLCIDGLLLSCMTLSRTQRFPRLCSDSDMKAPGCARSPSVADTLELAYVQGTSSLPGQDPGVPPRQRLSATHLMRRSWSIITLNRANVTRIHHHLESGKCHSQKCMIGTSSLSSMPSSRRPGRFLWHAARRRPTSSDPCTVPRLGSSTRRARRWHGCPYMRGGAHRSRST